MVNGAKFWVNKIGENFFSFKIELKLCSKEKGKKFLISLSCGLYLNMWVFT